MKAIILSIAVLVLSSLNLKAADDYTVVFTNVDENTKECTTVDRQTLQPISKTVYENNIQGLRVSKINYSWDESKGWISRSRQIYSYNEDNSLIGVSFQVWDVNKQIWKNI